MSFERIWTALFAGACAAVPATLCVAAIGSMIAGVAPFSREGLSPTVLGIWAALSLACALPARPRQQWLAALWLCTAFLAAAALLFAIREAAAIPALACATIAALLTLVGRQIGQVRG